MQYPQKPGNGEPPFHLHNHFATTSLRRNARQVMLRQAFLLTLIWLPTTREPLCDI